MNLKVFITLVMVGCSTYIGLRMWMYWGTTEGTFWGRARATAKHSATILWQYIVVLFTSAVSLVTFFQEALGDGTIQMWVKTHVDTEVFGMIIMLSALISIWTRSRTL